MYTQHIYKKALVNYENKTYWLDSIYSISFGDPWIKKIESKQMTEEDAVNALIGNDDYKYELNINNLDDERKLKEEEEKKKKDEEEAALKQLFATNLSKKQLEKIASKYENNINVRCDMKNLLSGIQMFKNILCEYDDKDNFEDEEVDPDDWI